MDPVAGAFQNYSDDGFYKYSWGGVDSLDELYKDGKGAALPVQANSWQVRETLSWSYQWLLASKLSRCIFQTTFSMRKLALAEPSIWIDYSLPMHMGECLPVGSSKA